MITSNSFPLRSDESLRGLFDSLTNFLDDCPEHISSKFAKALVTVFFAEYLCDSSKCVYASELKEYFSNH